VNLPQNTHGHAILGDLLMQKACYHEAGNQFEAVLKLQPEWGQLKMDLTGAIYIAQAK
jgi:predicted Zn-dependent protease